MCKQRGVGLEILGILVGLSGLVFWLVLLSASSYRGPSSTYGGGWQNFVNFLQNGQGQLFLDLLLVAFVLTLLISAASLVTRWPSAPERQPTGDEPGQPISSRPEEGETERR